MDAISWSGMAITLGRLGIAFLLAFPIGWDRESREGGAGLRTFPLVSVASCAFVLMAVEEFGMSDAIARVIYGVITGIGFIGGGAIVKQGFSVSGTATAASLWNTGAIGVAVALARYEIGVLLAVLNFVTMRYLALLKPTGTEK